MNHPLKLKNSYFASCPVGVEEQLLGEIKALKIQEKRITRGGVYFGGQPRDFLKVMFFSRIASRVYKRPYSFTVADERDIYEQARQIKWKALFSLEQTFKIRTVLGHAEEGKKASKFHNSIYLSQLLKDAIVDHFRDECGERPSVNTDNPDVDILFYVEPRHGASDKEEASVLIDLCGAPLFHRGYRQAGGEAPVSENLAAAVIKMMAPNLDESKIFIDGMCGSGTFLIESMLHWAKIPPSYLQAEKVLKKEEIWAFQRLPFFSKNKFLLDHFEFYARKVSEEAQKGFAKLGRAKNKFIGLEISFEARARAVANLESSKLSSYASTFDADATAWNPPKGSTGYFFCNPPYGKRLGDEEGLKSLYRALGENLKRNFKGFDAYVLTGNPELRKCISLQTKTRTPLMNGPIECRLLHYPLY